MAARSVDDWPLIGRDDVVAHAWEVLEQGAVGAVVLVGDAGIGKSRTAAEVGEHARAAGWSVRRVTASRAAASIPFGALASLLPAAVDSSDRLALLQQTQEALRQMAGDSRLLLWIDDAHLLDEGSATLVGQLVDAGSARLLLTVRSGERVPDTVSQLWRGDHGVRIDLEPLDAETTGTLLEVVLGPPVAAGTAFRLWQRSGGNPLMLREVVRATLYTEALSEESGAWLLSDTAIESPALRDLVRQRLGELSSDEQRAVELLALADTASVKLLLQAVPGLDLSALEERALIDVDGDGRRTVVQLSHPVYAEVTREMLPVTRRMREHGLLIDLVTQTGARRREDTLRIATWSLDSDHEAAPELLEKAAEQALARLDLPLAERLADSASRAGAGIPATITMANATWRQGRHDEALALLEGAAAEAVSEDEIANVADAHAYVLEMAGRPGDAWRVLTEAGKHVQGDRRYLLDSQATILSTLAGRALETLETVSELRQRAASQPAAITPLIRLRIDYAETFGLALQGRYDEAERLARSCYDWIAGDPELPMPAELALVGRVVNRMWAGRLSDAARDAEAIEAAALELGDRDAEWTAALYRARVELAQGSLVEALDHFTRAAALARELDDHTGVRWTRSGQAMCRALLGEADVWDGSQPTDFADDGLFEVDLVRRAAAWADVAAGRLQSATTQLSEAAELARDLGQVAVEVTVRHDLVRLGDCDQVEPLTALASAYDQPLPNAVARRAASGDDPTALLDVAELLEQIGARVEAAECAASAAEGFRKASASREATSASRLVARLLDGTPRVHTPALTTPVDATPLTKREREVATLAARQVSAADIAKQLHLSRRTVENHLQRIYTKLGISSRAELADSLARE